MWDNFNNYAQKREIIKIISEKIGVAPGYVFIALLGFIGLLLLRGFGTLVIILFLSFMFPAYLTFKTLKEVKMDGTEKDKELITKLIGLAKYWVVLSFIVFIYVLFDWILGELPFISFIKFGCAYFLIRGNGKGATYIYDNILAPFIGKYESFIDEKLQKLDTDIQEGEKGITNAAHKIGGNIASAAMGAAFDQKNK